VRTPVDTTRPAAGEATLAGTGGVAPVNDAPLRRGDEVGRYVVLENIGRGAMGVVYKAFDPQLDRAVALKLLLGEESDVRRGRLMREAQAIAKVSHPNVIAVHDVGTHHERVFFAMELVDGRPLSRWLADEPSVEEILNVFRQAGAGLAAAHAAGLVHRDFKPDNVLVDGEGRVRVLDFGLARVSEAESTPGESSPSGPVDLTRTGAVLGTPAYMSPEQFAGAAADARSDQFSYCVALHEALTGKRPFEGDTYASLGQAVLTGKRAALSFGNAPDRVIAAMDRGLSPEPADRFPSMEALLQELAPRTSPRWGRLVMGGGAVLALTTAAAYGLGVERGSAPDPDPCEDAAAPIDEVWNATRSRALADAFAASGAANADFVSRRVTSTLDAYADRWRSAAERSCEITKVEYSLDPELSFRSEHCVTASLEALAARLDAMASLDAEAVQGAIDEAGRLPEPDQCTDVGRLRLRVALPADPELRAGVERINPRLLEAITMRRRHDSQSCLELIAAVEREARTLGHGPTIARALRVRTMCETGAGLDEKARHTQQLTFEAALASGHDDLAIGTAADVAMRYAQRTDELDRAETWIRRGLALAERHEIDADSSPMRALLNARGVLASRQGNFDESVARFQELADMTRDTPGAAAHHLGALQNVGVTLAHAGRKDEALASFRSAVAFAEKHWGPGHPRLAEAQSRVAQVLIQLNRIEEAREIQRTSMETTARFSPVSLDYATALQAGTAIEQALGNTEAAYELALQAYDVRQKLDALGSADATEHLNTLSALARQLGKLDAAERYARESLEVRENGDWPIDVAEALPLLAAVQRERGDLAEARALMQRAEALTAGAEDSPQASLGVVLYRIAGEFLALGATDRALALFAQADGLLEGTERQLTNAHRLDYASALAEAGQEDEARALLDAIEQLYTAYPYPAELLDDAKALRTRLGPPR
jgi:tetratricopeptide (TPR) repeat protein/predicted Ser/Thr protein kinase